MRNDADRRGIQRDEPAAVNKRTIGRDIEGSQPAMADILPRDIECFERVERNRIPRSNLEKISRFLSSFRNNNSNSQKSGNNIAIVQEI